MKRQSREEEEIFANYISDKDLLLRIYSHNSVIKDSPIKKCTKNPRRHFSREDMQMSIKHMKRCSIFLVVREMQIKTTIPPHTHEDGHFHKNGQC